MIDRKKEQATFKFLGEKGIAPKFCGAFKNGRLVGYRTGELPVDIVGTGHILNEAAYQHSFLYGLTGVGLAIFMGWGAAILFRRR